MTSPTFFLQNSWETVGSENHLSKPDVREIAKAYPRIPAGGHKSSGISQTAEVDVGCPAGEEPFTSCSETPSIHMGGGVLPPAQENMETLIPPAASDTKRAWSCSLRLFQCVSDAKHKLTPGSCWRQHNPPLRYQQLHHALMSPQNSVFMRTFSNGEILLPPWCHQPLDSFPAPRETIFKFVSGFRAAA